jgi:hypothetical protein
LCPKCSGNEKVVENRVKSSTIVEVSLREMEIFLIISVLVTIGRLTVDMDDFPIWIYFLQSTIDSVEVESSVDDSDMLMGMRLYICYYSIIASIDDTRPECTIHGYDTIDHIGAIFEGIAEYSSRYP